MSSTDPCAVSPCSLRPPFSFSAYFCGHLQAHFSLNPGTVWSFPLSLPSVSTPMALLLPPHCPAGKLCCAAQPLTASFFRVPSFGEAKGDPGLLLHATWRIQQPPEPSFCAKYGFQKSSSGKGMIQNLAPAPGCGQAWPPGRC